MSKKPDADEPRFAREAAMYLAKPYHRVVLPEEDHTWRGEIMEFSGCFSTGERMEDALKSLEEAALSWIASALAHNQTIPEPIGIQEYSGRLVLRLPRSLHKKAAYVAATENVSLNQFITMAVSEAIGERKSKQSQLQSDMNFGRSPHLGKTYALQYINPQEIQDKIFIKTKSTLTKLDNTNENTAITIEDYYPTDLSTLSHGVLK